MKPTQPFGRLRLMANGELRVYGRAKLRRDMVVESAVFGRGATLDLNGYRLDIAGETDLTGRSR